MTGSAVLEGAVAAYRAPDARGLDTLPAGVLLTAAQRGGCYITRKKAATEALLRCGRAAWRA